MNKAQKKILIFHVYKKDGSSLFLHPFERTDALLNLDESVAVEGWYGKEPRIESLTMFRNQLYRYIETAVKEWVQDKKFIPRFIISAGVFLVVYFFTSFVIRDPIPVIDETVVSLLSSIAVYYLLSKRDQSSEKASKKRLKLRMLVDRIVFNESAFIREFEKMLHHNESVAAETLVQSMLASGEKSLSVPSSVEESQALIGYLEKMFSGKIYRRQERKIVKMRVSADKKGSTKHIIKWARSHKVDLPLFAVYHTIKIKTLT